jgi:hypothetical protein
MKNVSSDSAASTASSPEKKARPPRQPVFVWPTARRPVWVNDADLECLPNDARQEAIELIASAYQELVVEARSALERAAGEEFVFLFWIGLVRSLRLRGFSRLACDALLVGSSPEAEIQYYLQLGLAKQRVATLLMRVREWQARWQPAEPPRPAAAPAAPPPKPAAQPAPIASGPAAAEAASSPCEQATDRSVQAPAAANAQPHAAADRRSEGPRRIRDDGGGHSSSARSASSHSATESQADRSLTGAPPNSGQGEELEKRESGGQNAPRVRGPVASAA